MSAIDAVDGSSTGTSVPWMWALLRLPRFRGASDADDNDNRFGHRKVSFPGSRRRRWRPGDCSQAIEASLCTDLLPEAIAVSGRHRSLRLVASLVARTPGTGSHGAVDAAGLREAYVKRQKNDATDAEAICEAVTRANMRFVPTKTPEQQSGLLLHRTRHLFIRQQTAVINAIRGHLAEFGIVAPVGRHGVEELLNVVADPSDRRVPEMARACLLAFGAQLRRIKEQILEFDRLIRAWHRSNETSMRLDEAPGVGPVLATAVVATVADPKAFRSGRNFSAWIGLVPKQHSSGGKNRLGGISKQGDRYLRGLFVAGALAVIRYAKIHGTKHRPWLTALLARRPTKVAAIALANKIARMVWAMMVKGERYKEPVALAT